MAALKIPPSQLYRRGKCATYFGGFQKHGASLNSSLFQDTKTFTPDSDDVVVNQSRTEAQIYPPACLPLKVAWIRLKEAPLSTLQSERTPDKPSTRRELGRSTRGKPPWEAKRRVTRLTNLELGGCVCRSTKGGVNRGATHRAETKEKSNQSVLEAFKRKPRRVIACSTPRG